MPLEPTCPTEEEDEGIPVCVQDLPTSDEFARLTCDETQPDNYILVLTSDLDCSGSSTPIQISGKTVNCQGYRLTGNDAGLAAIDIGTGNTNLLNCVITGIFDGILVFEHDKSVSAIACLAMAVVRSTTLWFGWLLLKSTVDRYRKIFIYGQSQDP
ncbi:MAG: hypothetical protein SGARI_006290 [Bacillariaceae sp.]